LVLGRVFGVGRSNGATFEFQESKMAADGHLGCTKMGIEVMFGSSVGFPAELGFVSWGLHARTAVARNPCVSWAFLYILYCVTYITVSLLTDIEYALRK